MKKFVESHKLLMLAQIFCICLVLTFFIPMAVHAEEGQLLEETEQAVQAEEIAVHEHVFVDGVCIFEGCGMIESASESELQEIQEQLEVTGQEEAIVEEEQENFETESIVMEELSMQEAPVLMSTRTLFTLPPPPAKTGNGETDLAKGTYAIRSALSDVMVMDINYASTDNGANAQIYTSNASNAQKFTVDYDKYGRAIIYTGTTTGKVLDVMYAAAENGNNVWQYEENGSDAQYWILHKQADGSFIIESALPGNYCLDVRYGETSNGTNIHVWEMNGTLAQQFFFINLAQAITSDVMLSDGNYTIASKANITYVVDVPGASTADGKQMQIYESNGTMAQLFHFERQADTSYVIRPMNSGSAVDVEGSNIVATTKVLQNGLSGAASQKWFIKQGEDGTSYKLISAINGLLLDIRYASIQNGTGLWLYYDNGTDAQRWFLTEDTSDGMDGVTDGYYALQPVYTSKVLDVSGGSRNEGANVQLYSGNQTFAQKYKVTKIAAHTYTLQSTLSGYYVAEVGDNVELANGLKEDMTILDNAKWVASRNYGGGVQLVNLATGNAMDVHWRENNNGTNIDTAPVNGTPAQAFKFLKQELLASNQIYMIKSAAGDVVLDVKWGSSDNGANVWVYEDNKTSAQMWTFRQSGNAYQVKNEKSGKYLTTDTDSNVVQRSDNGEAGQKWELVFNGDGTYSFVNQKGEYLSLETNTPENQTNVLVDKVDGTSRQAFYLFEVSSPALQRVKNDCQTVFNQVGRDLRACYNWVVGNIRYVNVDESVPSGYKRSEWYASYGIENHIGTCYHFGASIAWLAKELGYDAHYTEGTVPLARGGMGPHGWCEVVYNGTTYIIDPDFAYETGKNGYWFVYGTSGTWRYTGGHWVD